MRDVLYKLLLTALVLVSGFCKSWSQSSGPNKNFSEVVYGDDNDGGAGVYASLVIKTDAFVLGDGYMRAQIESIEITGYRLNGKNYSGNDLDDCGISFPFMAKSGFVKMDISASCTEGSCSFFFNNDMFAHKDVHMLAPTEWSVGDFLTQAEKDCFNKSGDFQTYSKVLTIDISSLYIGNSIYGSSGEIKMAIEKCLKDRKEEEEKKRKEQEEKEKQEQEEKEKQEQEEKESAESSSGSKSKKGKDKEDDEEKDKEEEKDEDEDDEISIKTKLYMGYMQRAEMEESAGNFIEAKKYFELAYSIYPSPELKAKIEQMELSQGAAMALEFVVGFSELDPGPGELRGTVDISIGSSKFNFIRNSSIPNFYAKGMFLNLAVQNTFWFSKKRRLGVLLGGNAVLANPVSAGNFFDANGSEINEIGSTTEGFHGKYTDMQGYLGINAFGVLQLSYLWQYQGLSAAFEPMSTVEKSNDYFLVHYGGSNSLSTGIQIGIMPLRKKRLRLRVSTWLVDDRPKEESYLSLGIQKDVNAILSYGTRLELGWRAWSLSAVIGTCTYYNRKFAENSPLLFDTKLQPSNDLGTDYFAVTLGFGYPW